MLEVPEGNKVQYTSEQVRTALANATGIARTALLLGLNCGFTKADIGEFVEQEHVINGGTHISKVRSKLPHKQTKVKPVWWLWPETKEAFRPSRGYPDQHDPIHGRPAEAVPVVRPDRPEDERDRAEQDDPEVEAVQSTGSTSQSSMSPSEHAAATCRPVGDTATEYGP